MFTHTRTFHLLLRFFPPELVLLIGSFWFGFNAQDAKHVTALRVVQFGFPEGIEWFLRNQQTDIILLNQMLYGAAMIPDIQLSLYIIENGATDVETAVNLALEQGYMPYIRALLYFRNSPSTPLSLFRWTRYLEKQS